jgi:hypothetical protein
MTLSTIVGMFDDTIVGKNVGMLLAMTVGVKVGMLVSPIVGTMVVTYVSVIVDMIVGRFVGRFVGMFLGRLIAPKSHSVDRSRVRIRGAEPAPDIETATVSRGKGLQEHTILGLPYPKVNALDSRAQGHFARSCGAPSHTEPRVHSGIS